jgi:hypothetical protein
MLEELRDNATNGDFHNKWGFGVAVLLTGAVDVLGAAEVVLAALETAHNRLSETYTAGVKLAYAKFGSTMLARNQYKKHEMTDVNQFLPYHQPYP